MGANGKEEQLRLGFLTAVEVPEKGYIGGLLVTTYNGRPLEFQCTVPVKPNPTQEILYGPTLEPFVLGELIGGTLLDKAGIKPHLILTDRPQILELRNHTQAPVAFVSVENGGTAAGPEPQSTATTPESIAMAVHQAQQSADAPLAEVQPAAGDAGQVRLGRQWIRFHGAHAGDAQRVQQESHHIPADADLCEPFDRVREALLETLRCGALR
jgi:hypothetical protein